MISINSQKRYMEAILKYICASTLALIATAPTAKSCANPVEFCITPNPISTTVTHQVTAVKNNKAENNSIASAPQPIVARNITINGESYKFLLSGCKISMRDSRGTVVSAVCAPQDTGQVNDLKINNNNWVWISGSTRDYEAKILITQQKPSISQPEPIPNLYKKPCNWWSRLNHGCELASSVYSASLQRAFLQGFKYPTQADSKPTLLEISETGPRPLPIIADENLIARPSIIDAPATKGILIRSRQGSIIFYNGTNPPTEILTARDTTPSHQKKHADYWDLRNSQPGGRVFILNKINHSTHISEVLEGGSIRNINGEINTDEWIGIYDVTPQKDIVFFSKNSIFIESGNKLQPVAKTQSGAEITRSGTTINSEGDIIFSVSPSGLTESKIQPSKQAYFALKKIKQNQVCRYPLDFNSPIILSSVDGNK